MKKTLLTLALALGAGCAMATQTTLVDLTQSVDGTVNTLTYTATGVTGTIASTSGNNFGTVASNRMITNISFLLNLTELENRSAKGNYTLFGMQGTDMTYLGICVNNDSNTIYTKWGNSSRTGTLKFKGEGSAVNPSFSDFETVVKDGVTYALVNLTLNTDGGTVIWKDAENYWVDSGLKAGSGYTSLYINNNDFIGALTINSEASATIADNWQYLAANEALVTSFTPTPVDPTPVVPEPATATLSLLALAGLAARRRRK